MEVETLEAKRGENRKGLRKQTFCTDYHIQCHSYIYNLYIVTYGLLKVPQSQIELYWIVLSADCEPHSSTDLHQHNVLVI